MNCKSALAWFFLAPLCEFLVSLCGTAITQSSLKVSQSLELIASTD